MPGRGSGNKARKIRKTQGGPAGAPWSHRGVSIPWSPTAADTVGWLPTCECGAEVQPAVVLDPFGGAGTVGLAATKLTRDAVLIEIGPKYVEMARKRLTDDNPLFSDVKVS